MLFHKEIGNRISYAIPVVLVAGMVVGFYYCYVAGFLMQCDAPVVVFPSILFHLTLVLMLWSYVMCLCIDPQRVPEGFEEMTQSLLEDFDYNKEDYEKARVNVCEKCHIRRPPRTHHCSLCDKCVLRMDHHCPWVGNCVGFGNHKFFIQFVLYAFLTTLNLGVSCACTLESLSFDDNPQTLIGALAGITLSLSLGGLTSYHLYLVVINKTTLEMMKYERFNVFDTLSKKENFSQVFGNKTIGYILPLKVVKTIDGIVYPLRIRNAEGETLCIKNKLLM